MTHSITSYSDMMKDSIFFKSMQKTAFAALRQKNRRKRLIVQRDRVKHQITMAQGTKMECPATTTATSRASTTFVGNKGNSFLSCPATPASPQQEKKRGRTLIPIATLCRNTLFPLLKTKWLVITI